MKKVVPLIILFLIISLPLNVMALSLDKNNLTIKPSNNETIALYAEVDETITEVNFSLVYTTYDVPAYFNVESGLTDQNSGIKHKITFAEPVTGKVKLGTIKINVVNSPQVTTGTVNIHSATALTNEGIQVNLNTQIINVAVEKKQQTIQTPPASEEDKKEEAKTNLLDRIESEIVKIDIQENVYEYIVNIKEEVEELDLNPIAKEEDYKVEISNQKISELENNEIIITIKDGDNKEEYKIKVNILENIEEIEIDEEEFETTYKYKGKWVTLIVILVVVLLAGLILNKNNR